MTLYKRTFVHRGLKARQDSPQFTPSLGTLPRPSPPIVVPTDLPISAPQQPTPQPSSLQPSPPPPATSQKPPPPPATSATTTTTQAEPAPTVNTNTSDRDTTPTPTPTSPPTTPKTSPSDTPSSSPTSIETSATPTQTTQTNAVTPTRPVVQNSFVATGVTTPVPTRTLGAGSTIFASETSTNAPSGALSTGAIIGSVGGGIVGVALIGLIVAFFLRRWRSANRRRARLEEEEFTTVGVNGTEDTFRPVPPSMAQRQLVTASIVSGPGMAGQGAYGTGLNPTVQERPHYTYGQEYDIYGNDDGREHAAGGAYSSEPQVQTTYNSEAYGSYAHQGQNYQAQPYQPQQTYQAQAYQPQTYQGQGYPASQSRAHVQNGTSANGSRVSHYDEGDAYGGI